MASLGHGQTCRRADGERQSPPTVDTCSPVAVRAHVRVCVTLSLLPRLSQICTLRDGLRNGVICLWVYVSVKWGDRRVCS